MRESRPPRRLRPASAAPPCVERLAGVRLVAESKSTGLNAGARSSSAARAVRSTSTAEGSAFGWVQPKACGAWTSSGVGGWRGQPGDARASAPARMRRVEHLASAGFRLSELRSTLPSAAATRRSVHHKLLDLTAWYTVRSGGACHRNGQGVEAVMDLPLYSSGLTPSAACSQLWPFSDRREPALAGARPGASRLRRHARASIPAGLTPANNQRLSRCSSGAPTFPLAQTRGQALSAPRRFSAALKELIAQRERQTTRCAPSVPVV